MSEWVIGLNLTGDETYEFVSQWVRAGDIEYTNDLAQAKRFPSFQQVQEYLLINIWEAGNSGTAYDFRLMPMEIVNDWRLVHRERS